MDAQVGSESYYVILGVSRNASIDEIRRAYRKLAMVSSRSLQTDQNMRWGWVEKGYSVNGMVHDSGNLGLEFRIMIANCGCEL